MLPDNKTAGQSPSPEALPARWVQSPNDALALLDLLFDEAADTWSDRGGADWWDQFYADRNRPIPFFRWAPDESLVAWQQSGQLGLRDGARVLELIGRGGQWLAVDCTPPWTAPPNSPPRRW